MDTELNPYATPHASLDRPTAPAPDAAAIRREHLNHEASLRALGGLQLLGAVGMIIMAFVMAVAMLAEESEPLAALAIGAMFALLAAAYGWVGTGLRRLDPRVRIPATLLAAFGMLSPPIGTLINGYLLYLIHSKRGKVVLTSEYQEIMRLTPQIKRTTSPVVWVALGLIILALLGAAVAGLMA